MSDPYHDCNEVSPECPISATAFSYQPNLAGNIILMVVFLFCTLAQAFFMFRKRTWSFGIVVLIGCLMEVIGYAGRIQLHNNVWSDSGAIINAVCLIIAPSFLAAGIYLTLKHIVLWLGPQYSRLKPVLWVWIFVGGDIAAVMLQAAGGGIASAADTKKDADTGNNLMIGGLVVGVVMQFFCILLAFDFGYAIYRDKENFRRTPNSSETSSKGFTFYMICTSLAFLFIFIRSIYRVPELVGGWGNPRMKNEVEFMVLDGMMIAFACILMSIAHPGIYFPGISSKHLRQRAADPEASKEETRETSPASRL